jgi:hypothetical protein
VDYLLEIWMNILWVNLIMITTVAFQLNTIWRGVLSYDIEVGKSVVVGRTRRNGVEAYGV